MSVRSARAASRLARDTRAVARHARAVEGLSLMDIVERQLARRAEHVAAIAVIDGELSNVFERLAADRPASVPTTPLPRQATSMEPAETPATKPARSSARAKAVQADLAMTSHAPNKWPRGESCRADVLKAIESGFQRPREMWTVLDWGRSNIKAACRELAASGRIERHGATHTAHYTIVAAATYPATGSSTRRTVRGEDGTEFETVWSPGRNAASLLGDRDTRGSTLGRL